MSSSTEERRHEPQGGWEDLGRAAEHLARRIARDARRFAERVEQHVGEFAHDVRRDWRCGRRADRHGQRASAEDVRRVFDDIRGVMSAVLDGVDELIGRTFHDQPEAGWTRVVCAHDVTCGSCARPIAAGQEAHVRGAAGRREFRCLACGTPGATV